MKAKHVLGAAALLASAASANVAYAAVTDYYWINGYPNGGNADQAAVAAAGGIVAASGTFTLADPEILSFSSISGGNVSANYTIDLFLATTPGTVHLTGPDGGLDNTLFEINGAFAAPTGGMTVGFRHDDGVSLYLDGSTTPVPGLTPGPTSPVLQNVFLPGGSHTYELIYGEDDGPPAVLSATMPSVPEASTWAMMLAGFGGLGFLGFRFARKAVSIA